MFGWVLRFILLLIIIRAIWRFARGLAEGLGPPAKTERAAVGLVRDPVCGTFVVPSRALTAGSGSETRFFCSERCRQAWSRR
jgi:YHS domain-containing protein